MQPDAQSLYFVLLYWK